MTATRPAGHESKREDHFDAQLARLATAQDLVFALAQLQALGCSRVVAAARARRGRLHRVHHGVYSLIPPELLTIRGRYRAAVLACTGGRHRAALSHRSAADLQGLRACHRRTVEVIVPGRSTHRHAGIQVHRSVNLTEADLTVVDGITVTTAARTLLDLAAVVPARALERALDQAENLRVFDLRELTAHLDRNPRHPGAGRLSATLDRYRVGSAQTASEFEEAFLSFCAAYELAPPEVNAYVDPGDGGVLLRPDFVWRDRRLAVEVDGEATHLTHHAFQTDRRRDQRLVAAGWRVIRVTWSQLTGRSGELATTLLQLYGAQK